MSGRISNSNQDEFSRTSSTGKVRESIQQVMDELVHVFEKSSRNEAAVAHRVHNTLGHIASSVAQAEMKLHPMPPNHDEDLRKRIRLLALYSGPQIRFLTSDPESYTPGPRVYIHHL